MTPGAQQALRRTMEISPTPLASASLQHVEQNYRAYSESVCDTEIREGFEDTEILKRLLEICRMEKATPVIWSINLPIEFNNGELGRIQR